MSFVFLDGLCSKIFKPTFFDWRNRAGTPLRRWVAIWLCWANLVIHRSALHAAGLMLSKADAVYAWR